MSTVPLTPGIYRQPLAPMRAPGRLARGDVPALLGYAVRGPVGSPVRVYGMEQFEQIFGTRPVHGHLWDATKGFFENGGQTAYVVRVATDGALPAHADLPGDGVVVWRTVASFPWPMIDPRRLAGADVLEAAGWVQVFEEQLRRGGLRTPDPGPWGNGLALDIRRTSLARTETVPDALDRGPVSWAHSLAGIDAASVLELTQISETGKLRQSRAIPHRVDPELALIHWGSPEAVLPCQLHLPLRIASIEFTVQVFAESVPVQRFAALSPHPRHPAALAATLAAECRQLEVRMVPRRRVGGSWIELEGDQASTALEWVDWTDETNWPTEGTWPLTEGTAGLEQVAARHWLAALGEVARLPDAALICCPDLVLGSVTAPAADSLPERGPDCDDLSERPTGLLRGLVTGIEADGSQRPLSGVQIQVAGTARQTRTGPDGGFTLSRVPDGVVLLRLRSEGYAPLDVPVQSTPFTTTPPVTLTMSRLATARKLPDDEMLTVQRAMCDPTTVGDHKVALLDPPRADARLDELLSWRSRLGEAPRGFFAMPWLLLPDRSVPCPPAGHLAGAFAAAELAAGIHHGGANRPLRYVQDTTLVIDDLTQQQLNPVGINPVRSFPGRGHRLHGARSLSTDPAWRFITVRRLLDAIEKSLLRLLEPVVFEPNNELLWQCATTTVEAFLARLHRAGMLAGNSAAAAFTVLCDEQVNPPAVRDAGRLVIEVAVAATVPYEFITFRIGNAFDAVTITEEG